MAEKSLENRAQILLKTLIERYIRDGQPVGSKTLVEDSGLSLSSATVRHVLAELEDQGYLYSPHTSAGRIPTPLGYRYFVDMLLTIRPLSDEAIQKVRHELNPHLDTKDLLSVASSLISEITSLTGLVTLPRAYRMPLTRIEFLALSSEKILVVLVLNDREVQHRIIQTHRNYAAQELREATDYVNHHFIGLDITQVKRKLTLQLQTDKRHIGELLQSAIDMPMEQDTAFVMSGPGRELFEALTQKIDILSLFEKCLASESVQIYIGEESGLITSPYCIDGQTVGVLAAMGPTRMPYDKVIPMVDMMAKILGTAITPLD